MKPDPIILLYTPLHPIGFSAAVREVERCCTKKKQVRLFAINIHNLLELHRYTAFATHVRKTDIFFADGKPIVWLSRLGKSPLPERISGTDLTDALLKKNIPSFLFGSTTHVLTEMENIYPNIVGTYSPPFKETYSRKEDADIIRYIRQSKAELVFVALGSYRQDRWVIEHADMLPTCSFVTVGSAFDILSGNSPRAPKWMQSAGLEWVWRIWIDPRRLIKRYLVDIMNLIKLLLVHEDPFRSYKNILYSSPKV